MRALIKKYMQLFMKFIKILFLGDYSDNSRVQPAIKRQCKNILNIWNNKGYKDFGIERIIRLLLAVSQFLTIGLWVRHFAGKKGKIFRKIGVELYVLIKLFLPIIFFYFDLVNNFWVVLISSYMIVETIIYLTALIYLTPEFTQPISYRRSITTLFLNYIQICLDFAVIYYYCNKVMSGFFNEELTKMQSIYFSFVTSATIGYGDITVETPLGQTLVIIQIILFLVFVGLFINFFGSKVNEPTYFNRRKKYNNKNKQQ